MCLIIDKTILAH